VLHLVIKHSNNITLTDLEQLQLQRLARPTDAEPRAEAA
jgi:hypothetical protein